MSEEKRKVDNAQVSKPLDEITDGFYDLKEVYSGAPKKLTREEELIQRDKKRRESELQAIFEDIERRYTIHLEEAKSNAEASAGGEQSKKSVLDFEADTSVVSEEIERMEALIGTDSVTMPSGEEVEAEKKEIRKDKKKSKKDNKSERDKDSDEDQTFDLSQTSAAYAFIYGMGDAVSKAVRTVFLLIFRIISLPFKICRRIFGKAAARNKNRFRDSVRATLREIVHFRREIKSALRSVRKALRKPFSIPGIIVHYIKKAYVNHKQLLKSATNVAMPVLSVIILVITLNYWSGVTFALEVVYNNKSIGYISNESVYVEAKDIVKNRLSTGDFSIETEATAALSANLRADYKIAVVSIEELNDAQTISDKMIENSVDNLTNACGVYIDGKFICAVKNEADAKSVFYSILEPYESQAQEEGYVVGFAQNIDYVQGLYRDDKSVMWDAVTLADKLSQPKEEAVIHTVSDGDTLESIAAEYELDESELAAMNPDYNFENMLESDRVTVKQAKGLINIKKTVTTTEIRDIKFDTVKKKDSTKYSGYKKVEQQGVDGSERVIKTMIYIDGEHVDTKYDYETIVEPVDEIVTVGTKTYYDGVYVGSPSESGFLWPAPSCHYVSSPYGWRNSGWHNGIDLIKAGGGANGTPVVASRSGTVEVVQRSNSGYGNMVLINHGDGYKTRYAHMISGSITVRVGDYVEAGRTIGRVGSTGNSTGPHLHFEVIYKGETQNPRNYIYG